MSQLTVTNFRKALLILRKKKRLESTLEKSELHLEQLEKMTSDIEFSQIQLEVVEGLRIGNESLKQLNQLLNVEDIENLLDETREGAKKQEVSCCHARAFDGSLTTNP